MTVQIATSVSQAKELIIKNKGRKIELAFDINTDDFFMLASMCCEKGGKVIKKDPFFRIVFGKGDSQE
ncbi:hypothetical protein [Pantoea sp. App145]|uniref:hypothetical protein n=1 Tax=Pantoea sp. App145 TaxID=3071567 RepID=UPI003A813D1D